MALGNTGSLRNVPGNHGRVVDLGPRTSGALLSDFHATAMAQLAGERRIHHSRLQPGARIAFHRQLVGLTIVAKMVAGSGNPVVNPGRHLHCLSIFTGEGPRHVAKPFAAAASACAGFAAWVSRSVIDRDLDRRHSHSGCSQLSYCNDYSSACFDLVSCHHEPVSPADDLGRGFTYPRDSSCTTCNLGNGTRSLQKRLLDWHGALADRRTVAVAGDIKLRESSARRGRCAAGISGNDALRECLRAGRAVSAAGVELLW